MPGMDAVTSMPLTSLTRATLRRAEFGFFGVVVYTRVHTPRFWGLALRAGLLLLKLSRSRPRRMSWLIVGMNALIREIREEGGPLTGSAVPCQGEVARRSQGQGPTPPRE